MTDLVLLADTIAFQSLATPLAGVLRVVPLTDWLLAYGQLQDSEAFSECAIPLDLGRDSVIGAVIGDAASSSQNRGILETLGIPTLEGFKSAEATRWLLTTLIETLHKCRLAATEDRRAAAILRSELLELQESFAGVDLLFYHLGSPTYSQALDLPATAEEVISVSPEEVTQEGYTFEVSQPLPVTLRGTSGLDLFLTRLPLNRDQILQVAIVSSGREVSKLDINWNEINLGWNSFRFDKVLTYSGPDASLNIRCKLNHGDSVGFALTAPIAVERFHLRSNGACPRNSVLALRIYRGVSGLSHPAIFGSLPRGSASPDRSTLLMPSQCPAPELCRAPPHKEDYVKTDYWANENAVMVHGTVKGEVTAVLRGVAVEDVSQVSAVVNSMHRQSPVLGFALAAVPSGSTSEPGEAYANWTVLMPGQWGETHALLQEPYTGPLDLFLTVMVANDPGASNWAWGLFRAFRLLSNSPGSRA